MIACAACVRARRGGGRPNARTRGGIAVRAQKEKRKAKDDAARAEEDASDARAGMHSVTTMNFVLAFFFRSDVLTS